MVVGLLVAEGAGDVADPGESHKDEGCIGNVIADGQVDLAAGVGFGDKTSPQSPGKFHCSGVFRNLKRECPRSRFQHYISKTVQIAWFVRFLEHHD